MALTHLIDTSVIKRLPNGRVRSVVEPLATRGTVGRATTCDLEVGYSARNSEEWNRLMAALAVFPQVASTADHIQRALQVQYLLAERSQRGRKIIPDLLVAAAAEEKGLVLLHYDADFDLIAEVTGQRAEWVVPAGTVD